MKYYLILLPLLFGSFSLSVIVKKKIEECIASWIFLTVFLLYIFAILGILSAGFYFVVSLSAVGSVISFVIIFKKKKFDYKLILRPGLFAFVIFSVLCAFAQEGRLITAWDEFSHWGLAAKNMYVLDASYNSSMARIQFPGYPPGLALFQYFNLKLAGSYQESVLFLSVNLLYFSMAVYLFKDIKWSEVPKILFTLAVILVLPNLFYREFYFTLYVDSILGIIFGYILLKYFAGDKKTYDIISTALPLFMLSMVKASGVGLSILALVIMLSDTLYSNKKSINTEKIDTKSAFKKFIPPLIFLYAILFAKFSWEAYLKLTNTAGAWDTSGLSLSGILAFVKNEGPAYQKTTLFTFISAMFTNKISSNALIHTSYAHISIIIFTLSILFSAFAKQKSERNKYFVAHSLLFLESIIYAVSLLLLYMFTYSESEAVRLASSDRYLSTFLLGSSFFIVSIMIYKAKDFKINKIVKIVLASIVSVIIVLNFVKKNDTSLLNPPSVDETVEFRAHYSQIENIKEHITKDDKVFFLAQGSSGIAYHISRYLTLPLDLDYKPYSYSIGSQKRENDLWTMEVSDAEFIKTLLKEYDYIYIFHTDEEFNERYGSLFSSVPEDRNLYKIQNDSSGYSFITVN